MPHDLDDLIFPEGVVVGLAVATRKALFQQIGQVAAPIVARDATEITRALIAREKIGSTGFGGGVAIPHARIAGLPRIVAVVARLVHPLDFDAVDDVSVDIVVALLSPAQAGADHLKALARISRRLRDARFVDKLRGAGSADALYALLTADDARDAA